MINIEEFAKVEMRAGKILSVETIEGSEKLLKLSVDFGDPPAGPGGQGSRPRQVVSGIRKYFEDPQELVGVKCGFVTNLEPRPLMGLVSEAMIMAVSTEDSFSLLKIDESIPAGTRVK